MRAWGRKGFAERIDRCIAAATAFAGFVAAEPRLELLAPPESGVVVWRTRARSVGEFFTKLPGGIASQTKIGGEPWLRCVATNPVVDMGVVFNAVADALSKVGGAV